MGLATQRQVTPELMDAPDLDAAAHDGALRGLRRLNRASGAAGMLARPIVAVARRRGLGRVTILDVACGGGDVPVGVARALRRAGIVAALVLTDRSATALEMARRAAEAAGMEVRAAPGQAPEGLPEETCDFVTNSLFLHHLGRAEVVATLAQLARRARVAVVLSDLRRSALGMAVAWVMCRLLSRSRIVHYDGPVSVRAAWTVAELRALAAEAGLAGATVRRCWPWRMVLVWERP